MNYKKIEQDLIIPSIDCILELGLSKRYPKKGFVFTLYRDYDKKIVLGFTKDINFMNKLNCNYLLIDKRTGNKSELKLLKSTLFELGHTNILKNDCYKYSKNLIRDLNILGWPIGRLSNRKKIKKSFK
tara:strand:- start:3480 stop:3863 length:384 start_codon:yes stop_codon:yes gene_type:complete